MSENLKKKVAVYFDCENVSADFADFVFNRLDMDNKKPIIKQAFRDWSKANCWNQELLEKYSIKPIQVFANNFGKNGADVAITVAAMKEINKNVAQSIVLVSSDSDFTHLAQEIRANGLEAIGFGESKAPERLRNAYDIFVELPMKTIKKEEVSSENMAGRHNVSRTKIINDLGQLELLTKAINAQCDEEGWCNMAKIGNYLKDKSYLSLEHFGESWREVLGRYPSTFELKQAGNQHSTLFVKLK